MKVHLTFKAEKENADSLVSLLQNMGADISAATDTSGKPMYLVLSTKPAKYEIHFGEYIMMIGKDKFAPCIIPALLEGEYNE